MAAALWYRRPDPGEVASIKALELELPRFAADTVGTMLLKMLTSMTRLNHAILLERRPKLNNLGVSVQNAGFNNTVESPHVANSYWTSLSLTWGL